MIETIARAISPLAWARKGNAADKLSFQIERNISLLRAKAVLKAIRQPNKNMLHTAYDAECWRRMIDAAMKE